MRQADQICPRIRDGWNSCVGNQACIAPCAQWSQQARKCTGICVDVQLADLDFLQGLGKRMPRCNSSEMGSSCLCVLCNKVVKARCECLYLLGNKHGERVGVGKVDGPERVRDEIEGGLHANQVEKKGTPARRSMVVNAINGRPVRAVGSELSILSIMAMPSPSFFALPAQSYGSSSRR